jgi:hypothetical protein
MPNASSKAMTSSTVSRLSAARSSTSEASGTAAAGSMPRWPLIISTTFVATSVRPSASSAGAEAAPTASVCRGEGTLRHKSAGRNHMKGVQGSSSFILGPQLAKNFEAATAFAMAFRYVARVIKAHRLARLPCNFGSDAKSASSAPSARRRVARQCRSVIPASTIHMDRLAGDETRVVADQEQAGGGNLLHMPLTPQRNAGGVRRAALVPLGIRSHGIDAAR